MTQTPGFEPGSLVGSTIDGRYRLTAHIASGGMGAVFRAEHVYMRKDFAVKVLRPDLTASTEIVERFRREAEIAASLEHENIVRVTDFGKSPEGFLFLVMELLEGESLFDRARAVGPLPAEEVIPVLVQVCAGLEAAHRRGVVHRDLKPENIFLHHTPQGPLVKILDFGIAKITDPTSGSTTNPGMVVGTPEYLSPEQAIGSPIDSRADIYAVGIIAWRVLTGQHPFRAEDPRALLMMQATQPVPPLTQPRPDLAAWPDLVAAVSRACAKGANERQPSAGDLGAELEAIRGPSGSALPLRLVPPAGPTSTPHENPTPPLQWSAHRTLSMWIARARERARRWARATRGGVRDVRPRLRAAWLEPRKRRGLLAAAAALLVLAGAVGYRLWIVHAPGSRGASLLAAGKPEEARPVLEDAVARRPDDAHLRVLLGRTLHRLGRSADALDAFDAAAALDPEALAPEGVEDLVADLGRDRRTADRAARLLVRAGPEALPQVLAAASAASGSGRLRALEVARDLGAEDKVDRAAAYGELLADADCAVRRAAARRLGEIGEVDALPSLKRLATSTQQVKGFLGILRTVPACGSAEAAAAIRRIEASAAHAPSRPDRLREHGPVRRGPAR